MPVLTISAGNSLEEIISTLALVFAIKNWDEFAKEFKFDQEDEFKEMTDDIKHITASQMYKNHLVLNVLCSVWGPEKVTEFVETILNHDH